MSTDTLREDAEKIAEDFGHCQMNGQLSRELADAIIALVTAREAVPMPGRPTDEEIAELRAYAESQGRRGAMAWQWIIWLCDMFSNQEDEEEQPTEYMKQVAEIHKQLAQKGGDRRRQASEVASTGPDKSPPVPVSEPGRATSYTEWRPTHRHYKGGLYRELMRGTLEASMTPVVVYQNQEGRVWVRPVREFDGEIDEGELGLIPRFTPLPIAPSKPDGDKP